MSDSYLRDLLMVWLNRDVETGRPLKAEDESKEAEWEGIPPDPHPVNAWWEIPVIKDPENEASTLRRHLSESLTNPNPLRTLINSVSSCWSEVQKLLESLRDSAICGNTEHARTRLAFLPYYEKWDRHYKDWCEKIRACQDSDDCTSLFFYFVHSDRLITSAKSAYCDIYANLFVIRQMNTIVLSHIAKELNQQSKRPVKNVNPDWASHYLSYYCKLEYQPTTKSPAGRLIDKTFSEMERDFSSNIKPDIISNWGANLRHPKAKLPAAQIDKALNVTIFAQRLLLRLTEIICTANQTQEKLDVSQHYPFLECKRKLSVWGPDRLTFDAVASRCNTELRVLLRKRNVCIEKGSSESTLINLLDRLQNPRHYDHRGIGEDSEKIREEYFRARAVQFINLHVTLEDDLRATDKLSQETISLLSQRSSIVTLLLELTEKIVNTAPAAPKARAIATMDGEPNCRSEAQELEEKAFMDTIHQFANSINKAWDNFLTDFEMNYPEPPSEPESASESESLDEEEITRLTDEWYRQEQEELGQD